MEFKVDPEFMRVDEPVEVRITAVLDHGMGVGENISFALPESWSCQPYCVTFTKEPQCSNPSGPDYVAVLSDDARFQLALQKMLLPSNTTKGHVRKIVATLVEGQLNAGNTVVLWLHNFRSTWLAEAATVRVWLGDGEIEGPKLRTLAGEGETLRVIVPSSARPNTPFVVNIVSYDRGWNRSCSTYRNGVLRVQDGPVLEEDIAFAASYRARASIAEPGVYWLTFNKERSNPIRITENPQGPYWGDTHSHDKVHNCGAGEDPYTYAREVSCLDFVAVSPDYRGLSYMNWDDHVRRAQDANAPGQFTALLAYEVGFRQGHHNVYFRDGNGVIIDTADESMRSLDRLLPLLNPDNTIVVPHHLGIHWCSQDGYHPERDAWIPLLEVYSSHGQSEMYAPEHALSYEYNRTRGLENKHATSLDKPIYARDAWAQGRRYGVVASSDDHMAQPGKPIKGLAAVYCPQNTREAIFQSLKKRYCYGTTGERILMDLRINGHGMGEDVFVSGDALLAIEIEVHGTDDISFVEVMRLRLGEPSWQFAFKDRLKDQDGYHELGLRPGLTYATKFEEACSGDAVYYLRVGQRKQLDNWPVLGWTSPIWVTQKR